MGSTDPGGTRPAVPVADMVRALRRLAPGAALRPVSPQLAVLASALRHHSPAELALRCPSTVVQVVLAAQVRALDRAMTGWFGSGVPEAARLVRAARFSGRCRTGALPARLRAEPGLRAAALDWAEAGGGRLLADELRGVPLVPDGEDGRRAAELVVAALLPRAEVGAGDREVLVPRITAVRDGTGFLEVRSVRVGERGFRVDVRADPPVDFVRESLALRALWWNGLGRVTDDLGHEYLVLRKDPDGTGIVRHWCHPRPAPGARVLRLESAGYRGELLRLDTAAPGTSAEVLVKRELTVRLGCERLE
ncbi:hypothetical protein OG738_19610 [Amycolatopsis sp. NBC_01488]|uniref:hypothetical protein n=1 Tax=Amycolatopsis sp. NBC_01488 TaxID=2903563 RepID=UPI002E2D7251|nr:hypothetical protein [Amycolatopsis sp. NBC_01488]